MSGVGIEEVGVDIRVKLGDSRSNRFRDMRLSHFVTDERHSYGKNAIFKIKLK